MMGNWISTELRSLLSTVRLSGFTNFLNSPLRLLLIGTGMTMASTLSHCLLPTHTRKEILEMLLGIFSAVLSTTEQKYWGHVIPILVWSFRHSTLLQFSIFRGISLVVLNSYGHIFKGKAFDWNTFDLVSLIPEIS